MKLTIVPLLLKPKTILMKKPILFFMILFAGCMQLSAQSVSSDYFEVFSKPAHPRTTGGGLRLNTDSILARIRSIGDTSTQFATFAAGVADIGSLDSVVFTLTDSRGQLVYTGGGSLSSLQSNASFRVNENTLYYTVGPFAYLKRFTATVRLKSGTSEAIVHAFTKN